MRHKKTTAKLGKAAAPRKAMFRGLATSLVLKGKMVTTLGKAKAIRQIVEKYVTMSRKNDLATRRRLLAYFYQEKAVKKLLEDLGPKYLSRKGGYTRIIKLDSRKGDNAPTALIEFV